MPDWVQYFLFVGFTGLMLLLRLDTRRFGAAEWDTEEGGWRAWAPRLTWYIGGVALALLIFALHPSPVSELNLSFVPDRPAAILVGLVYGVCGSLFAFGIAWVLGGRLRLPSTNRYAGGVVGSIGTAFYDEFLFRGVLLGFLMSMGLEDWAAVVIAAVVYAVVVWASTKGRGVLDTAVAIVIGLASGLVVLLTFGIAGAVVGHAISRFALFLALGHPQPVTLLGTLSDAELHVIPPRARPPGMGEDDGRGGFGPIRPA